MHLTRLILCFCHYTDCGVLATRVMLLLDDLLWVLTDTQLKAAILYINSLKDMMKKSRQQSKNTAAEKLDVSYSQKITCSSIKA
jgi:hypothetical protein